MRPRQLVARCPRLKDQGGLRQQRDWSPSPELALQDEDGCVPWPRARLPHLPYQPIGKWGAGPRTRARMNWQSLQAPGRRRVGKKEAQTMFYKHRLHCGGWAVGVSLLSGSRTRRPARSAAPAAPLGGGGEGTVTLQQSKRGSRPASPTTLPAPHHWAQGPSHPRPHPRPAQSPLGWPAAPAQPAPPGMRHSWGGWGPHSSAGPDHLSNLPRNLLPEELAHFQPPALSSPHKQDLVLGPWGLVTLGLGRQLLCPLLQ